MRKDNWNPERQPLGNDMSPENEESPGMKWFDAYCDKLIHGSVNAEAKPGVRYRCPCCGYLTLDDRGGFQICQVCFWEDDGQDDHDATCIRGGPNGRLSLSEARLNYKRIGACDEAHLLSVRPPRVDEL